MKKFTTKTLLALACVAVASVQIASADVTTGTVLSGADITSHSGGLTRIEGAGTKEASLNFNANTKVNWGHLNVAADEKLHFLNGNHAILNVVEKGASKFAGQVTSQAGKIIISNPNGILFTGSSASANFGGEVLLTTKDLASFTADQIAGLTADDVKALANGSEFRAIAINGGATVKADDITIITNGVSLNQGNLISDGDILVTADGANYVKTSVPFKNEAGETVGTAQFYDNNNISVKSPLLVMNSAVKAENGDIVIKVTGSDKSLAVFNVSAGDSELKANNINLEAGHSVLVNTYSTNSNTLNIDGNVNVKASQIGALQGVNVNGNVDIAASRSQVSGSNKGNSKVNGNLTMKDTLADYETVNKDNITRVMNTDITGKLSINEGLTNPKHNNVDPVYIKNITAGDTTIVGYQADLYNVKLGNTDITTWGVTSFANNSVINGNLSVKTDSAPNMGTVLLGGYSRSGEERGTLFPGETFDVAGNMTIDSGSTVGIAGLVTVGGKADITTHHSSVTVATSDTVDCDLVADGGLVINAPESVNRLVPLSGDVGGVTWELTQYSESGTVTVSPFFVEMQRDYVIHDPEIIPDPPIPDPKPDPKPTPDIPDDEPSRNLNNLVLNGIDTSAAQTFTPIAFAADEEPDVVKRIAKIVFKTPDGVVSISDRLIQKDIDSSN